MTLVITLSKKLTTLTMLRRNSLSITGQTHEKLIDVNLFVTMTNCQVVRYRSLTHRINYKLMSVRSLIVDENQPVNAQEFLQLS